LLAKSLTDLQTALWAVLFFVTNPFLNEISIIPFQEILMLGALCFATYLYIEKRIAGASLVLTLACLTRRMAPGLSRTFAVKRIGSREGLYFQQVHSEGLHYILSWGKEDDEPAAVMRGGGC
jgi:hypothetical protein